jgi:hypothetical protein
MISRATVLAKNSQVRIGSVPIDEIQRGIRQNRQKSRLLIELNSKRKVAHNSWQHDLPKKEEGSVLLRQSVRWRLDYIRTNASVRPTPAPAGGMFDHNRSSCSNKTYMINQELIGTPKD